MLMNGSGWSLLSTQGSYAPPRPGEFATLDSGAHDRRLVVRKHARHRREVADVPVDHAEQRDDGRLVGRDRVEIADVDGPPLVKMVADF